MCYDGRGAEYSAVGENKLGVSVMIGHDCAVGAMTGSITRLLSLIYMCCMIDALRSCKTVHASSSMCCGCMICLSCIQLN